MLPLLLTKSDMRVSYLISLAVLGMYVCNCLSVDCSHDPQHYSLGNKSKTKTPKKINTKFILSIKAKHPNSEIKNSTGIIAKGQKAFRNPAFG